MSIHLSVYLYYQKHSDCIVLNDYEYGHDTVYLFVFYRLWYWFIIYLEYTLISLMICLGLGLKCSGKACLLGIPCINVLFLFTLGFISVSFNL